LRRGFQETLMTRRSERASPVRRIRTIPRIPARPPDAHKGSFGRVLVVGGSTGMAGAPVLAGWAALRAGAGLVTIASPEPVQPTVACLCPCATTVPLPATSDGRLDPVASVRCLEKRGWLDRPDNLPDALVIGPGLGMGSATHARALWKLIDRFRRPSCKGCVIDADALNLARAGTRNEAHVWNRRPHPRTVVTPHPGELGRMHGVSAREIQADREGFAVRTARQMSEHTPGPSLGPVVVLKGAGTLVTDGSRMYVNRTGNPGMATGGSGDVLSGIIGAFIAQGMDLFEAAVLGVYVHGRAGDRAARRVGQVALTALDIIEALPEAFRGVDPSLSRR